MVKSRSNSQVLPYNLSQTIKIIIIIITINPSPLQPISNREARPPLTGINGSFFLVLESFLGVLGAWVWGGGDSKVEAKVAMETVTQHRKGAAALGGSCGDSLNGTRERRQSPILFTKKKKIKPISMPLFL